MKKLLLTIIMVAMTACGFQPMFSGQDTDIYVSPISGINGIDLRNALWAEFGGQYESNATYTLNVKLNTPITKYKALERTGAATWQEISVSATYTLLYQGKVIAKGSETVAESYTLVRYLVASNASYNNAVQNAIRVLAEKIGARAITATHKYSQQDMQK